MPDGFAVHGKSAADRDFCNLNELYKLTESITEPIRVGTVRMAREPQKEKYGVDAEGSSFSAVTKSADIRSYEGLMLSCLQSIFDAGYSIKKCERCGRFFIPCNRYDTKYCSRRWPGEGGKSCGELVRTEQAAVRREQFDDCKKAYRSIRNSLNNSRGEEKYRGKTGDEWWQEFEREIPEKLYLTQRGEYIKEQFMIDLDKYRKRAKRK